MADVFLVSWDLTILTLLGVVVNFGPQIPQFLLQVAYTWLFFSQREGHLPIDIASRVFGAGVTVPVPI